MNLAISTYNSIMIIIFLYFINEYLCIIHNYYHPNISQTKIWHHMFSIFNNIYIAMITYISTFQYYNINTIITNKKLTLIA